MKLGVNTLHEFHRLSGFSRSLYKYYGLGGLQFSKSQHPAGRCSRPVVSNANRTSEQRKIERGPYFHRLA